MVCVKGRIVSGLREGMVCVKRWFMWKPSLKTIKPSLHYMLSGLCEGMDGLCEGMVCVKGWIVTGPCEVTQSR